MDIHIRLSPLRASSHGYFSAPARLAPSISLASRTGRASSWVFVSSAAVASPGLLSTAVMASTVSASSLALSSCDALTGAWEAAHPCVAASSELAEAGTSATAAWRDCVEAGLAVDPANARLVSLLGASVDVLQRETFSFYL